MGYKMFDRQSRKAFRKVLKEMLDRCLKPSEIKAEMAANGIKMPDGRAVHISTIGRHAHAMGYKFRGKRARRKPRVASGDVPVNGKAGMVAEILTAPGLSETLKIKLIGLCVNA